MTGRGSRAAVAFAVAAVAAVAPARGQFTVDYGRLQPGGIPAGSVPDLSRRLMTEARQFVPTVRAELTGTTLGRQLEIRGHALLGAVEAFDAAQRSRIHDPAGLSRLLAHVQTASQQVEDALYSAPGAAPQANRIARRISRLIYELSRILPSGGLIPPRPPVDPGYDVRTVAQLSDRLAADINALINTIEADVGSIDPYDTAIRDLQGTNGQLADFRRGLSSRPPLATVQSRWHPVRNRFRRTSRALASVRAGFDRLTSTLGLRPDYIIGPDQPAIIDLPAYDDFPYPRPPVGQPGRYRRLTSLADRAISEVDGFLLGIRPNIGTIPEGPRFQADGVALRNELLALRQHAAAGNRPALPTAFGRVESAYQRLADRTDRIARGRHGPNIARVGAIGDRIRQMQATVSFD
jgi:hypothetical protein